MSSWNFPAAADSRWYAIDSKDFRARFIPMPTRSIQPWSEKIRPLSAADAWHTQGGVFIRWDEKAGLPRDAIRSQCSTCSRHKEKETGNVALGKLRRGEAEMNR